MVLFTSWLLKSPNKNRWTSPLNRKFPHFESTMTDMTFFLVPQCVLRASLTVLKLEKSRPKLSTSALSVLTKATAEMPQLSWRHSRYKQPHRLATPMASLRVRSHPTTFILKGITRQAPGYHLWSDFTTTSQFWGSIEEAKYLKSGKLFFVIFPTRLPVHQQMLTMCVIRWVLLVLHSAVSPNG